MLFLKYLGIAIGPRLVPSAYNLMKINQIRTKQHLRRSNQLESQSPGQPKAIRE